MEILGIGPLELMLIGLIALLVIKPEDWGKTGRTIANWINQITSSDAWRAMNQSWRAASEFSTELRREVNLERSLRELDEFTTRGIYRTDPRSDLEPDAHSAPEAGEPETNLIRPPRSAPYVAAQMIRPPSARSKSAAGVKATKRAKTKRKPTSSTKRKPAKKNA